MFFHPENIEPPVKFPAAAVDLAADAVSQLFMESHRAGIFPGDQGQQHPTALELQQFLQRQIQPPADAPPLGCGLKVNGGFCAPAVGSPLKGPAGIGIAQDLPVFFPDQPGIVPGNGAEPV